MDDTYKENVDDVRESPTLQLMEAMEKHLASPLKVYDPYVKTRMFDTQIFDLDEFLSETDLVIVMVGHDQIKENTDQLKSKIVLDTRNLFTREQIAKLYKL